MKNTIPINENRMFKRLYRQGKSLVTPYFVVYYRRNRIKQNRLGITATKKLGNAVQRNRARRVIKEAYRLREPQLPVGIDIVIVARKKAVYCKMNSVLAALGGLAIG